MNEETIEDTSPITEQPIIDDSIPKETDNAIPKAKKPRSEKQILAFSKAQAALKERREKLKLEKEQGIINTKASKVKSKKKEKLETTIKEVGISMVSEDRVKEIIKSEKNKRTEAKNKVKEEKAQKIKEARELLGIEEDTPIKAHRKAAPKRSKKVKMVEEIGETSQQAQKVKQEIQPKEQYIEPLPVYNFDDW